MEGFGLDHVLARWVPAFYGLAGSLTGFEGTKSSPDGIVICYLIPAPWGLSAWSFKIPDEFIYSLSASLATECADP